MKLSRLYSNQKSFFEPIDFLPGFNVVIAEIRLPENKNVDTHNLGKTTLGRLLDFCLLTHRDQNFFLFKHESIFHDFIFFLEIELNDSTFITIRRSVAEPSRISFVRSTDQKQDFTSLKDEEWDHLNVPFERAVKLLDGILDLEAIKPWSFRKGLGYQLRTQIDYQDVFQLEKNAGKHSEWKPYLAQLIGLNANQISDCYEKEDLLDDVKNKENVIKSELGNSIEDISKIEGLLLLKNNEAEKKQRQLDAFDFRSIDKQKTKLVIDDLDERIANLNSNRYSLSQRKKRILQSIETDKILFNPDEAEKLFLQAGVLFAGQIKKDFQQLIEFNKAITEERKDYLQKELTVIDENLKEVNAEINLLGKTRSENLEYLSSTDSFVKYKEFSSELVTIKADISLLERQRENLHKLQDYKRQIRGYSEEIAQLQSSIESDLNQKNADPKSRYSLIRVYFSDIIEEVIDRKALINVFQNTEGHIEFTAGILDENGKETSADLGFSYKKLLCIAFDLAILRAYLPEKFIRFVYHDGVFESLDNRKKKNLLAELREYSSLGLQVIITLIDSEIPQNNDVDGSSFIDPQEIILTLHDGSEQGRLFKMAAW